MTMHVVRMQGFHNLSLGFLFWINFPLIPLPIISHLLINNVFLKVEILEILWSIVVDLG